MFQISVLALLKANLEYTIYLYDNFKYLTRQKLKKYYKKELKYHQNQRESCHLLRSYKRDMDSVESIMDTENK